MGFHPTFCPRKDCPSRSGSPFTYRCRGRFRRHCDGRSVPRFRCLCCSRGFSEQTFRVNYRLKRPELLGRLFFDRVSKVSHRQSARIQGCTRGTEERHFRRLSGHCAAFHSVRMSEIAAHGGLGEVFLLDELETYEQHRTGKPVTVPILIERESGFVIDVRAGALAARVSARKQREAGEASPVEERKCESRHVVQAAFEQLQNACPKNRPIVVLTDMKPTYAAILRKLFGARCHHDRTPSTRRRDVSNPLWPINHTLARVRDNLSRLVRETWGAAKLRRWLQGHLAIWTCYRNYVRGRTNKEPSRTPAMALGAQEHQWSVRRLLKWRVDLLT